MTYQEFVDAISKHTELPKKDIREAIKAMSKTLGKELNSGEKITIPSFGSFSARVYEGVIKTGVKPTRYKTNVAHFKPSLDFKRAVNGK